VLRRTFLLTPLALVAAEQKPNVALVIAPGWRGVSTPWNSDPDLQAPNLAKFAENAVVFPRAYACDPDTDPGRSGIVTGIFPHENGVTSDGAAMRAEEVTLGAVLRLAGYNIASSTDGLTAPFFLQMTLDVPRFSKPPDGSKFHLRPNVPKNIDDEARGVMAERYAAYTGMDAQFGKILAAMDRFAADTIVIFTADHGEQLGSHGLEGAGVAFEESLRVPLAIRFPRAARPTASDVLASQVDILPTVMALCGQPAYAGIQGHDLSPVLLNTSGDRPESVFAEGRIGARDEWRMVVVGTDKLVVDAEGSVTDLYNLAGDPYEMKNLAHDPSAQLKRDGLLATLRALKSSLLDFRRR
jgi:arylsulfatase A-like enzyme